MTGWQRHAARLLLAAAIVAGGYFATRDAHDHTRPAPSAVAPTDASLASAGASKVTCARDDIGITCTEEITVVAPERRPTPAVFVTDEGPAR